MKWPTCTACGCGKADGGCIRCKNMLHTKCTVEGLSGGPNLAECPTCSPSLGRLAACCTWCEDLDQVDPPTIVARCNHDGCSLFVHMTCVLRAASGPSPAFCRTHGDGLARNSKVRGERNSVRIQEQQSSPGYLTPRYDRESVRRQCPHATIPTICSRPPAKVHPLAHAHAHAG